MGKLNNKLRKGVLLVTVLALCVDMGSLSAKADRRNVWLKKSGKTYYYGKKGKRVTGLKLINGKSYFFDKKGALYKKGWKTVKGKKYYFKKTTGAAVTGAVKIGKKRYLFQSKGQLTGTGLQKYGKKRYYTKKGVIQAGLKSVKNKIYYFMVKGPAVTGWKSVKGKKYYFGPNGVAVTGKQIIGGKTYQFSKKGVLQKELSAVSNPSDQNPENVQETPGKTTWPNQNQQTPERPVEPTIQDPSVTVPTVSQVENTQENMNEAYAKLHHTIDQSQNYVESWNAEDWEPTGYKSFMAVFEEAKAMFEATERVILEDRKWSLVFDASEGTFVSKQREFDPANYPYTATELLQEAEKLKAYEKQCLVLQKKLIYYPEQSKAIFNAINEYRISKGVKPLVWSENLSMTARLECGYRVFCYDGKNEEFVRGHGLNQCSFIGTVWTSYVIDSWLNSSLHEPWLRDVTDFYGAVAVYTCQSDKGVISKVIFASWSCDEMPTFSDGSLTVSAPEELWTTILNCGIDSTIIP